MSHNFGQKEESHLDRFLSREKEHQNQQKEETVRRAVAELNRPKKKSVGEYAHEAKESVGEHIREARIKARERGRERDLRAAQKIKYAARHPVHTFERANRKISHAVNTFGNEVEQTPSARNIVYRGGFIEPISSKGFGGQNDFLNSGSLFTRKASKSNFGGGGDFLNSGSLFTSERRSKKSRKKAKSIFDL